ncbi:MAG: type II toxin-antitoxin system RelE/ParE family toxin [Rhizobiaceae bacterium]|nr:type II toxin-antitoxin system RelE/ParE family toxin [Rhizobiaceae bacterium]
MRLVWSRHALADRDDIFTYLETKDPAAAVRIDEHIELAAKRLIDFPQSGRLGRIEGTRELVVPHTPYIAAYLVTENRVRILRVIHGAKMWPDEIDAK